MSNKTATIIDSNGDVWKGKVETDPSDVMDLVIGIVCPPLLPGLLSSSDETTVVVNDEKHKGRKV